MALTDAPVVTLAGHTLASVWTLTERIALGGLAITWGRRSHLDKATAAQLKMEVLDTDGHLSSATHLTGQPVTVARDDGRIIFRGRVDDYDVDHIYIQDPDLFYRRRVWRLTLTAACKIAALGQAVLPGPGNDPALFEDLGPNYWMVTSPAGRLGELMAAGANQIVSAIEWSDPYPPNEMQPLMRFRAHGDAFSALQHIESIYQARPLGYVEYHPDTDTIACGAPVTTSGLALRFSAGTLRIDFASGPAGRSVPARTVVMPSGYRARTGIDDAIDVVQISTPKRPGPNAQIITEHATSRNSPTTGRREHRVENDVMVIRNQVADSGSFEWPFSLSEVTSEYGPRPGIGSGFHDGIDFSGTEAHEGADIHVVGPGTYVGARSHPDWGNNVIIDHGNGLSTLYCHMVSPPSYPIGTSFAKGDTIGQVGNTGLSFGAHLHFTTMVNGDTTDPRWFMANKTYGSVTEDTFYDAWQRSLAADTAAMIDQLNGKLTLPAVRFDFRRFDYSETVTEALLDSYVRPGAALYFPGSVFNVALDAAAAHQAVGGTLVYHKGWTHDVTLAPAISTAPAGLTIDQLCASATPTLSQFDPDITLADLGNVSQGVPA